MAISSFSFRALLRGLAVFALFFAILSLALVEAESPTTRVPRNDNSDPRTLTIVAHYNYYHVSNMIQYRAQSIELLFFQYMACDDERCLGTKKVPEGLVDESGIPLNRRNIHIAKTSPYSVLKAYLDIFEKDFKLFLRSRSQEMAIGGYMVHTMIGSEEKTKSPSKSCTVWELLEITLNDMVLEKSEEKTKSPSKSCTVWELLGITLNDMVLELLESHIAKAMWAIVIKDL
ncbi:Salicylate carboxymethyltransferase [Morella rubra]|uniref:Salicylate carboxymethyltransferase n=1 Tax=Morella rubra TaxID=262757 RepID=A0A6A1V3M2_9ROSI|nr:Salicylate carboxymethyltransferase [Morella rubra]